MHAKIIDHQSFRLYYNNQHQGLYTQNLNKMAKHNHHQFMHAHYACTAEKLVGVVNYNVYTL